jgi:hypothetical protein
MVPCPTTVSSQIVSALVVLNRYNLFAVEALEGQKPWQAAGAGCDFGNFHSAAAGRTYVDFARLVFGHTGNLEKEKLRIRDTSDGVRAPLFSTKRISLPQSADRRS